MGSLGTKEVVTGQGQGALDGSQLPPTPRLVPTLVLKLPLLQLGLNLVQHHGQLPKDLLQVAHIVMF